jgi:DNA-binding NarL/FixJ family response regulator
LPAPKRKLRDGSGEDPITVMLVDDHPIWRNTLRQLLRHTTCEVVAEASDGAEAIVLAKDVRPDVIIMDLALPGMSGIDATRAISSTDLGAKVLVLSSSDEPSDVTEAVKAGAAGYLLKTLGPEEVADAIIRVKRGELVFPPTLSALVLEEFRRLAVEGPAPQPLRVAVADGAVLARSGLSHVLIEAGFIVTGQASSPSELFDLLAADAPDVAVVDARVASARPDGRVTVLQRIRARFPSVGILVLSGEADAAEAADMIEEGQSGTGYVLKERIAEVDELGRAIRRVAAGECLVDPQVVNRVAADGSEHRNQLRHLTDRERQVLALMAEGRSNQAIGEKLFLGLKTVEAHVHGIFTKLSLEGTPSDHRRVLAVITYLRST